MTARAGHKLKTCSQVQAARPESGDAAGYGDNELLPGQGVLFTRVLRDFAESGVGLQTGNQTLSPSIPKVIAAQTAKQITPAVTGTQSAENGVVQQTGEMPKQRNNYSLQYGQGSVAAQTLGQSLQPCVKKAVVTETGAE